VNYEKRGAKGMRLTLSKKIASAAGVPCGRGDGAKHA
jgi:hypothetical protein